MNCDAPRGAMKQGRALTAAEQTHVERCKECLDAWLDATVTKVLDAKPEVQVPAGFAARVAAIAQEKPRARPNERGRNRHWGLLMASVLVAVGLMAMAFADPHSANTRMGLIFMALVVTEIAGIALWLGTRRPGVGASRGHSRWSRE
jgi:hypothetical protein